MFDGLIKIVGNPNNDLENKGRIHSRRAHDICVCKINDLYYPVQNWSMSGLMIQADTRFFAIGQTHTCELKFNINQSVKSVKIVGHVVRRTRDCVAFEFQPLSAEARDTLEDIIRS